jgi:GTP cyclohydrolase I
MAKKSSITLANGHMEKVLEELFGWEFGIENKEPGIMRTPERFLKYLMEFNQPHLLEEVLGEGFDYNAGEAHGMVAQSNIPFRMVCEHHLLPATGRAAIGYIPNRKVVGLSKLTRLVQAVGVLRPSLQEVITDRIAAELKQHVDPKGVVVVTRAQHGCMACRGVNAPGVNTDYSSIHGVFRDAPQARSEFFSLIQNGGLG